MNLSYNAILYGQVSYDRTVSQLLRMVHSDLRKSFLERVISINSINSIKHEQHVSNYSIQYPF